MSIDNKKTTTKTIRKPRAAQAEAAKETYEVVVPIVQPNINPNTGKPWLLTPGSYDHKAISREEVETRFLLAFELIGGVDRFAAWADQNPGEYYKMYAKLLPDQKLTANAPSEIRISLGDGFNIPRSKLDDIELRDESEVNARYLNTKADDGGVE